ncbi:DNA-binding transcriptional regulator, MerR family [Paenibacillus sophorae]|uniref:DNA-binding transcriptional regulator, MerR family n=2 Tax=Paenibacillus sophorae TaxID=1333845 RepID=A0A1H8W0M0_9BACL|nr:MerR family transcriptional regulator [Paenibacillus sophorae]SEP21199.1 DNA-binding transcriptional regulator, MerR family [Paenibacillus sophorae]
MMMYSVSQISQMSGLPASTIRFYEKEGIIPNVNRNTSGRRQYSDEDLLLLELVICLKDTGMMIEEIKQYTHLIVQGNETIGLRREILLAHKKNVEQQLMRIRENLEQLNQKIAVYDGLVTVEKNLDKLKKLSF